MFVVSVAGYVSLHCWLVTIYIGCSGLPNSQIQSAVSPERLVLCAFAMRFYIFALVVLGVILTVNQVECRRKRKKNPTCRSLLLPNTVRTGCEAPFTRGVTCTYECKPGCVKIRGSKRRTCKTRPARWAGGRGLKCSCKPCRIPAIPNAGAAPGGPCFNTSSAAAGTTCPFLCDPGYTSLAGNTNWTCVNGRWTGPNVICESSFKLAKKNLQLRLGKELSNEVGLSDFWDALDELNDIEPNTIVSGNVTDKLTLTPPRWKMVYSGTSDKHIPLSLYTPAFEEFNAEAFFPHESTVERDMFMDDSSGTSPPDVVTEDFRRWFDSLPRTLQLQHFTDDKPNFASVFPSLGQDYGDLFGGSAEDNFRLSDLNRVDINDKFHMELFPPTIRYQDGGLSIEAELDVGFNGFNGVELRSFWREGSLQIGGSVSFDQNGNLDTAIFGLNWTF
ncbi:Hypp6337 [Branchiostoma lanceolatum]|uniref:Hypp6337 protein n=1 Tax=Branchiostoma lanceolatum TaxID=7740 RepID=A0A8K0E5B9_BRALA|nr:Hypp6337 [Branchiostoma lanceolatum]